MSRGGPHSAASVLAAIGMPVERHCACGAAVRDREQRCVPCERVVAEERRAEDIARRVKVRVPAVYRWATLEPGGALERAASGRSVAITREWLTDPAAPPILLLRGPTHVLKSTIAAACVRLTTEQGQDAAFVLGADLAPLGERPTEEQRTRLGDALHLVSKLRALVVIDDPSKVLGGAAGDSNIAAYRRGHLCATIHRRWQAKARTIITTDLENRQNEAPCLQCAGVGRVVSVACPPNQNREPTCPRCRGAGSMRHSSPGIVELFGEDQLARWTDENSAIVVRLERRR